MPKMSKLSKIKDIGFFVTEMITKIFNYHSCLIPVMVNSIGRVRGRLS
jgi:hypothetical protein